MTMGICWWRWSRKQISNGFKASVLEFKSWRARSKFQAYWTRQLRRWERVLWFKHLVNSKVLKVAKFHEPKRMDYNWVICPTIQRSTGWDINRPTASDSAWIGWRSLTTEWYLDDAELQLQPHFEISKFDWSSGPYRGKPWLAWLQLS